MSLEDRSINFFETVTVEELAEKLLEPHFLSFLGDGHRDGIDVLTGIYPGLDSKIQNKISQALVKSADDWNPSAHNLSLLKDVAFMSGINRIEGVFPHLVKIVEEKFVSTGKTAEDSHDFMIIVSCIGGSDTPEAREAVVRWYEDDKFDWKFNAIFCMSLIRQNPQNTRAILPKFLKTMDEHPNHFLPDYFTSAMTEFIEPDELENILKEFDNKSAKTLLAEMPVAREIYEELKEKDA